MYDRNRVTITFLTDRPLTSDMADDLIRFTQRTAAPDMGDIMQIGPITVEQQPVLSDE